MWTNHYGLPTLRQTHVFSTNIAAYQAGAAGTDLNRYSGRSADTIVIYFLSNVERITEPRKRKKQHISISRLIHRRRVTAPLPSPARPPTRPPAHPPYLEVNMPRVLQVLAVPQLAALLREERRQPSLTGEQSQERFSLRSSAASLLQGWREYVPAHAVCSADDDTALGGESQKKEKNEDKHVGRPNKKAMASTSTGLAGGLPGGGKGVHNSLACVFLLPSIIEQASRILPQNIDLDSSSLKIDEQLQSIDYQATSLSSFSLLRLIQRSGV